MAYSHTRSVVVASQGLTAYSGLNSILLVPVTLGRYKGDHAAASTLPYGTWRAILPGRPMTLHHITVNFVGSASAPQGGNMVCRVWSGATRKGIVSGSVAGATVRVASLSGLNATFPASAVAALSVAKVPATTAGGGATPTLWLTYNT